MDNPPTAAAFVNILEGSGFSIDTLQGSAFYINEFSTNYSEITASILESRNAEIIKKRNENK